MNRVSRILAVRGRRARRTSLLIGLVLGLTALAGASPAYAAKTLQPAVYYVNDDAAGLDKGTSWQDAFTDLQSALEVAVPGDQIWVAAGTYKPAPADRTASFVLKSGVAVYGGFAGDEKRVDKRSLDAASTILSGDIGTAGDVADNSYHVVSAVDVTGAVLDGFTVTAGRSALTGPLANTVGAGMFSSNSVVTVAGCVFIGNRAVGGVASGGGMYNLNTAATVTDCTFRDNQTGGDIPPYSYADGNGGGMTNYGSYRNADGSAVETVITGCVFADNVAKYGHDLDGGGGMLNDFCSPTVDRCTFLRNKGMSGGGIFNRGGRPTIVDCIFSGNWTTSIGRGGAVFNYHAPAFIAHDTFFKNGWAPVPYPPYLMPSTYAGGAVSDLRMGSTIVDCVFSENANAGFERGAYACEEVGRGPAKLVSCLFYGNVWRNGSQASGISDIWYEDSWEPQLTDILYEVDPLLADPAAGDFHLLHGSPCVDAGITPKEAAWWWWPFPAIDFEGDRRAVDGDGLGAGEADIGADEYIPNLPDLRAVLVSLADDGVVEATAATRFLSYLDAAQAALDLGDKAAAAAALTELIVDARATLGAAPAADEIEAETRAVIDAID